MVEGWTGWHGQGKTYCGVYRSLQWYNALAERAEKDGRDRPQLWSNATIQGAQRFANFAELLTMLEGAVTANVRVLCFVDEAGIWLASRFWAKMPEGILSLLQSRRRVGAGVDLIWTAPSIEHVDKMLRDVTQVAYEVKRYGGGEYSHDGGSKPRMFRERGYDPRMIVKVKREHRKTRWIPFSTAVAGVYETGVVDLVPEKHQEDHQAHADRPDVYSDSDRRDKPPAPPVQISIHNTKKGKRK